MLLSSIYSDVHQVISFFSLLIVLAFTAHVMKLYHMELKRSYKLLQ